MVGMGQETIINFQSSRHGSHSQIPLGFQGGHLVILLFTPDPQYLKPIAREGGAAEDLVHEVVAPEIGHLHRALLLEPGGPLPLHLPESDPVAVGAWLVVAVVELEEGAAPAVREQFGVADGLVMFVLFLAGGLPEIGEVEVVVAAASAGVVGPGHPPHPHFLVVEQSIPHVSFEVRLHWITFQQQHSFSRQQTLL